LFDLIVIGAGHAGCEAALAASRMGCRTALVTGSREAIGRMSCNPAIGGLAKGQLVRELDALGGEMGKVTDATGIQFRMLNSGKGPAVRSPRAQADRKRYAAEMRRRVEAPENLRVIEGMVGDFLVAAQTRDGRPRIEGILTEDGRTFRAPRVVLTPGTFLRGLMHTGESRCEGGRIGEDPARKLSENLVRLGFPIGRLKTGTPPRLDGKTIRWSVLSPQYSDPRPQPFSFFTERLVFQETPCHITRTNPKTHAWIRENAHRAPMFTGQIRGVGPRYCPSIEDKVVRFPEVEHHTIYLEPEGLDTDEIYVNGVSTSLPRDVQERFIRTIEGLEEARFVRYGYAVEYDFVPPCELSPTLETRRIEGLYFAGQLNGTSGYEEAAAQGFWAGVNAVLSLGQRAPFLLDRSEAYLGVLVDDLVTKDHREPYRMFTSRAEYRLHLRQDNADRRLMRWGHRLGLVPEGAIDRLDRKEAQIRQLTDRLRMTRPGGISLFQRLRRPEVSFADLQGYLEERYLPEVVEQVEIEAKYEGYMKRQEDQIVRFKEMEHRMLPDRWDYTKMKELSSEARQKLARHRPHSLGQASRIAGVSPADLSVLLIYLKRDRAA
jgi:tRNA uridine 5-carboxymethylaminomethyl modification enzyme